LLCCFDYSKTLNDATLMQISDSLNLSLYRAPANLYSPGAVIKFLNNQETYLEYGRYDETFELYTPIKEIINYKNDISVYYKEESIQ